jgi:hypothetical protein
MRSRRRAGLCQRRRHRLRLACPTLGAACDVVISVVVNAAQTEAVLFGRRRRHRLRGRDEARQRVRDVLHGGPELVGGDGKAAGRPGPALHRRAHLRRRGPCGQRRDDDDDRRQPRRLCPAEPLLHAMAAKVYRLGDSAGAGSKVKIINQLLAGVHIAAAAEAMALGLREGVDPAALYEVITHSAGNSWMFENRMAHGHLRERPRHRARHGPRQQIPAAAVEHRAPDVHAGLDRGLCERGRQRGDQDLSRH